MTIQDIIGTQIAAGETVYEIVRDAGHFNRFGLKVLPTGVVYYNSVYTINCFNANVKNGAWKVITPPETHQKTMEKQYITTKDLPDIAEGTISYKEAQYNYYFNGKNRDQVAYLKETVETSDFFREYIAPFRPKSGDYLYCHTSLIMEGEGLEEATKGKIYKCETDDSFANNSGNQQHWFGNEGAGEWFRLATEEEIKSYKETNKTVKLLIGTPLTEITINKLGWITGNARGSNNFAVTISSLIEIVDYFKVFTIGPIQGYTTTVEDVRFHIGCHDGIDVTLSELQKIVETYNNM